MSDPAALVALASAGTAAVAIASHAALRGWMGWLELRRLDAARRGGGTSLRELKARVRRLEAIADGVER